MTNANDALVHCNCRDISEVNMNLVSAVYCFSSKALSNTFMRREMPFHISLLGEFFVTVRALEWFHPVVA